jgi:hypothetical protein
VYESVPGNAQVHRRFEPARPKDNSVPRIGTRSPQPSSTDLSPQDSSRWACSSRFEVDRLIAFVRALWHSGRDTGHRDEFSDQSSGRPSRAAIAEQIGLHFGWLARVHGGVRLCRCHCHRTVSVWRSRASANNTSRPDHPTLGRPIVARNVGGARPAGARCRDWPRGLLCLSEAWFLGWNCQPVAQLAAIPGSCLPGTCTMLGSPHPKVLSVRLISLPSCACPMTKLLTEKPYTSNG